MYKYNKMYKNNIDDILNTLRDSIISSAESAEKNIPKFVLKIPLSLTKNSLCVLSNKKWTEPREIITKDRHITIIASTKGVPNMVDLAILIYITSQILCRKAPINEPFQLSTYDLLTVTNRTPNSKNYKSIEASLHRLEHSIIEVHTKTGNIVEKFSFIKSVETNRNSETNRLISRKIVLSDFLLKEIESKQMLTVHPEYYGIKNPFNARLYLQCRQRCGRQESRKIKLETLYKDFDETMSLANFRYRIKKVHKENDLLDYEISYDGNKDMVNIINRKTMFKNAGNKISVDNLHLSENSIEQGRKIFKEAGHGTDIAQVEQEFYDWVMAEKVNVVNSQALFIKFCKNKTKKHPKS